MFCKPICPVHKDLLRGLMVWPPWLIDLSFCRVDDRRPSSKSPSPPPGRNGDKKGKKKRANDGTLSDNDDLVDEDAPAFSMANVNSKGLDEKYWNMINAQRRSWYFVVSSWWIPTHKLVFKHYTKMTDVPSHYFTTTLSINSSLDFETQITCHVSFWLWFKSFIKSSDQK